MKELLREGRPYVHNFGATMYNTNQVKPIEHVENTIQMGVEDGYKNGSLEARCRGGDASK